MIDWLSYKDSLKNLTNKEKGDSFERLTKHFLANDPIYATKLKYVWLLSEVPDKIHKKLNLPNQDQGIDHVCETNEGEYWAVQCKYLADETKSLPWRMLSTFTGLAFGVCKNISFGLVCTTAERFTKVLKKQDNIGFCTGEVWRNLDENFFDSFVKHRKPKKLKAFKPYKHQRRAINNAHRHFVSENESRGKMIMPCGTGKSLTAFWIAEKLDANRILVAVPSLSLIRQTLHVWLRESHIKGWDVDWITVCSDESVGKISRDDLAVLKQDLGVPAVTDSESIAAWLRKKHSGKIVVFTTYQSGKAIAEASRIAKRNFDLGIMDEAHKTVGSKDKTFSHLLFDKHIKIAKRVFMTATERRYAGKKDEVISMDDLDVYGDTFEFLSFKEAIEETPAILSDYKIITMMISKKEVAELVKKRAFVRPNIGKWDDEIEADMLAALIALRKAIRRFKIKHAITFHNSIAKAKAFGDNQPIFTDLFPQYWKTDNFHVSGKMPTSVRDRHMQEFEKSKRAIMTNARCLTEGVDVPDIDCVMFADPKKSTIDIVQAVGRALRVSERKKVGYVIVPVMIEDDGKFDESDAFQSILMTLRALASNDERIIDYFRAKSQNKWTYKNIQVEVDERIAEKIDVKDFIKQLELKIWGKLAKLSWRPFEEARSLIREYSFPGTKEYFTAVRNGVLPNDIPVTPYKVYKTQGWASWGDWLGTNYIATSQRSYISYMHARKYTRSLGLKSSTEWRIYCIEDLLPDDIPKAPQHVYKNQGWVSWGDWLGTGTIAINKRTYRTFKETRKYIRNLGIKSGTEWIEFCKEGIKPDDIPYRPERTYKNSGWTTWGDFLGTGNIAPSKIVYRHYKEARKYARNLGLKSSTEWQEHCKKGLQPDDIPISVKRTYNGVGWISWSDFLGDRYIKNRTFLKYSEARKYVHTLNLKSVKEWNYIRKTELKPNEIPSDPQTYYKKRGWISWGDWLDNTNVRSRYRNFKSYNDARKYAQSLNIKTRYDWRKLSKRSLLPTDIPAHPDRKYKDEGWISWPEFLGYEPKRKKK